MPGDPIRLNGCIFTLCNLLKCVAASAAEAELGALFMNCKQGNILRLILEEMGNFQPPTPFHCDNTTSSGITNHTIKRHPSRSMEMRYFGLWTRATWEDSRSCGALAKKSWPTTNQNTILAVITGMSDHGTSTQKTDQ